MTTAFELYKQGKINEIWTKYCGFIDLSLPEFMDIQKRLLMEQIGLLTQCELGRRLFNGQSPASVEEFRQMVPLTTYADYEEYFGQQDESVLPVTPRWWLRTSGRTDKNGGFKWVPYPAAMAKKLGETVFALFVMAASSGRGDFHFAPGDRMLFTMAPFPYMSGGVARAVLEEFPFRYLPGLEEAEAMDFQERIQAGFKLALDQGMDEMNAIAIVLVRIGEQFMSGSGTLKFGDLIKRPRALVRLLLGMVKSRLDGRSYLLPRDLWQVSGIATGGTDTAVFRERIEEMWGKTPVEAYGCTEANLFSIQLWTGKGLTCLPDVSFLEFLPFEELGDVVSSTGATPEPVLLDEVQAGGIYEVVATNFHGGAFVRYRTGDLVQFTALEDKELNVQLPQMVFYAKNADLIDLGSFSRLTERMIWQAIENAGISYADWVARKEYVDSRPTLAVYIEPKAPQQSLKDVKAKLHEELKKTDPSYADLEEMLGVLPLQVMFLPAGAFTAFSAHRVAAGADLAHLKPAHINASDQDLELLMNPAKPEG